MMNDAISQYGQTRDTVLKDFGSNFYSFRRQAFRLELLPEYRVAEEQVFIKQFEETEGHSAPPEGFNRDWKAILQAAKGRAASIHRCRLIDQITPYLRFENEWGYKVNRELGEEIRRISRTSLLLSSEQSGLLLVKDFWLFDGNAGYFMEYDFFGAFLGVRRAEADLLQNLREMHNRCWANSEPMGDLLQG